ncbi:MAG: dynamin family protein [Aphanocapsa sp. GSE-SYN-MK-11-07L]|jgi:GTPase SAR1 family protein|nr:dynamin family protein [Aphanocapsa sp. GSE-SYN-MK-11-07L]
MSSKVQTQSFLIDLERVVQVRRQMAAYFQQIVTQLTTAETAGKTASGSLGLDREIEDAKRTGEYLQQGVFRLLVLGDMKRGKSTVLNALLGENLLPSDVNPCTALLTILKYGSEKTVTVHFNNGTAPEQIDFSTFRQRYTIDPQEAKQLEQRQQLAFPNVSHAVVEYPLPLLEKGVEIVDSPGLNDTEARNELSLGYIHQCHAVLFVLRASQPCTLSERRYLDNYIKDRNLTVFFLINAWDQVRESLIDPDDSDELAEAEAKLHQVFRANLAEYCMTEGHDRYDERVFPISALIALRRRIKDANANLDGTGFPEFMGALNPFLTEERAILELRQARSLARQVANRLHELIERRGYLLGQGVAELQQRIASVEPEFKSLKDIGEQFRREIQQMRDRKAQAIADSFQNYVLNLEQTFDADFLKYQPASLSLLDFLNQGRRTEFNAAFEKAFQQYVNDKFFAWTLSADKNLTAAFDQLAKTAERYGTSYLEVTDRMTQKLTGQTLKARASMDLEEDAPPWAKWAMGLFSLATGNFSGAALAAAGFDFNAILLNIFAAAGIAIVATSIFGVMLGPIALALVGLGLGAFQADQARKELAKVTKRELVKHLPQIAQQFSPDITSAVHECFDSYESEVMDRIRDDIHVRKEELDFLLTQKVARDTDREAELQRLRSLENSVTADCRQVEALYQMYIGGTGL